MTSKRRLRRRSCTNKVAHADEAKATRVAGYIQAKYGGVPVRAYKCPFCGKWHVGRLNQSKLQAVRAKQRLQ